MHIGFGGYIHYPGMTKRIGSLSLGYDAGGVKHSGIFLTKRYCFPEEQFDFHFPGLALFYNLVPGRRLWTGIIVILCIIAWLLGRFNPDLWGDHTYTGSHDFYVHDPISYELKKDWR